MRGNRFSSIITDGLNSSNNNTVSVGNTNFNQVDNRIIITFTNNYGFQVNEIRITSTNELNVSAITYNSNGVEFFASPTTNNFTIGQNVRIDFISYPFNNEYVADL